MGTIFARMMALASLGVYEYECTADGRLLLLAANPAADWITGLDSANLVGRPIEEALPCLAGGPLPAAMRLVAETGEPIDGEQIVSEPGGRPYELSAFQIAPGRIACVFRDVSERTRAEGVLRHLVAASSAADGPHFVEELARCLSEALAADAVFVGEIDPDAPYQMTTVGLALDGGVTEGVMIGIDASPCGEVLREGSRAYARGVAARFPGDVLLQVVDCEAFVGVPLMASTGQALGVMAALYRRPVEDTGTIESVLRIMSPRVAGELERLQVAQTLRESEQKFRAFVQNATDMTAVLDYGGKITFESPSLSRVLGYRPGELLGECALDLIHKDDLPAIQARLVDLAQRAGNGKPVEVRLRHREGRWLHLEIVGENLLRDPSVRGFLLTARDITERRIAEQDLRASERRFRSYFDVPMVGAAIWLPDGRCFEANERMCAFLGYSHEEMRGVTWMDLTHEDDLGSEFAAMDRLLSNEASSCTREKRYRRRDGSVANARVCTCVVRAADGTAEHIVSVVEDLDDRRRADEALRVSEQRYRHLVQASNDWVWEVDACAVYTYSSGHVTALLGYDPEEIVGKTPFDLMPPDEAARVLAVLGPIVERKDTFRDLVNVNRHKDGHLVTLVTNGVPFTDSQGRFAGYRGMDRLAG